MTKRLLISLLVLSASLATKAQEDSLDNTDYSQFGDATGVKRYATQKILNQSPQRIVSIGYEYQGSFLMPSVPFYPTQLPALDYSLRNVSGLRAQVNVPVISNTKLIWQLGANYANSSWQFETPNTSNPFITQLNSRGMHTFGLNTTIFKPLNEKRFLIVQASADVNGVFSKPGEISSKALTFSGAAIYGWKFSERNMLGVGIARTYRAGRLLYVPTLLWNKTFSDKWGMELLLPARAHLRRNFSTSSLLQLGYELEGNQYWMQTPSPNGVVFIQRGELKPRIMWDKKLMGFFWLNVQVGMRYNWRFDMMNVYDGRKDSQRFFTSNLRNPVYGAISINFVSP
jgi:hypothetical protein